MFSALLVVLTTTLLSHVFSSSDSFFFTQCECPSFTFNAEAGGPGHISTITQTGSSGFSCPGSGPIPDDNGVTTNFGVVNSALQATISSEFQQELGAVSFWHASFDLEYDSNDIALGDRVTIVDAQLGDYSITVTLEGLSSNSVTFIRDFFGSSSSQTVTDNGGTSLKTITIGLVDLEDGIFGASFLPFACMRTDDDMKCGFLVQEPPITTIVDGSLTLLTGSSLVFGNGITLKSAVFTERTLGDFRALIANLGDMVSFFNSTLPLNPITTPLPLVDPASFSVTEDVEAFLNLSSAFPGNSLALSFSDLVADSGNATLLESSGSFSYDPVPNAFGIVPFSFKYEDVNSVFTCTLTGTSQFDITQVDDEPVAVNPVFDTFASVPFSLSAQVASSGDFESGELEEGSITIPSAISQGTLFEPDCETPLVFPATIEFNETVVEFCFLPNVDFFEGSVVLEYSISTVTASFTIAGQMTFNGNVPVSAISATQTTEEDNTINFPLGADLAQPEFEELTQIRIVSLPDPTHGVIQLETQGEIPLSVNDLVSLGDDIRFVPAENFFNKNENNENTDFFGNVFPFEVTSFSFSAVIGDFVSDPATVTLEITAEDDEDPQLSFSESLVVEAVNPSRSEVQVNSPQDFSLVSDAGAGFFPVEITITAAPNSTFRITTVPPAPFTISGLDEEDEFVSDCIVDDCFKMTVSSTPAQLESFLAGIVFTFPVEGKFFSDEADFEVRYSIDDADDLLAVKLQVDQLESALTAVNGQETTFAGLPVEFSEEVAENVEGFPLEKGTVTIDVLPTRGVLFREGCVIALSVNDEVFLVENEFKFCYSPDETMLDDAADFIQYTVATQSGAFNVAGRFDFDGATPARTVAPLNVSTVDEGEAFTITTADLIEVIIDEEIATPVVLISQVPDATEAVITSGGVVVNAGDSLAVDSEILFTPSANFFNLNDVGENDDFFGNPINSGLTNFKYRAEFNGVLGLEETFSVEILAVDDGNPTVSRATDEVIGLTTQPEDENISTTVTNFEVLSDNGVGFFPIGLRVVAPENASMSFASEDLPTPPGTVVGECVTQACTSFEVTSTPAEVEDLLNAVSFNFQAVLNATVEYKVDLFVAEEGAAFPSSPSFSVDFTVTRPLKVDGVDDDDVIFGLGAEELGIYGGAGVGGLIALGLLGVFLVKKRRAAEGGAAKADEGIFKDEEIDPAVDI